MVVLNIYSRPRTKTNGTLNTVMDVGDNPDHIVAYKVEEEDQGEERDPVYCISNDLRLQQVQLPSSANHSQEHSSSQPMRDEDDEGGFRSPYQNIPPSGTYSQYDNYTEPISHSVGLPQQTARGTNHKKNCISMRFPLIQVHRCLLSLLLPLIE